ncbi:MAG: lipopolysaccharide heptosyltransferase II [Candidatus Poribacteria bacterium]|nr:lipopolysaccharide heptosyltransferase II [Candidatus Poribacteria bacterium]
MKNILLIRLSSLGDIVLTSPAIRAVRRHFPQAQISMLVAKQSAELLTENPHLDEVIPFDRTAQNKDTGEMWRIIRLLRERRFDLAIDFQRKFRTSLLAYLSGAKCRVGYHQPNGLLCTVRVPDRVNKHAIDRYFDLLHAAGIPATDRTLELFITDAEHIDARETLAVRGIQSDRLKVGLFPGAGWKLREWMPDRFAAIGNRVSEHFDAQVLIFGGPNERELVDQVANIMKRESISLAGDFSIRQFAALVKQCDLFITNDTGPMHVAAAMHTPTVALFGPGNHLRFQPLAPIHTTLRHHVPCNPCKQFTDKCKDNICMKLITVDEVWETICNKLSAGHRLM